MEIYKHILRTLGMVVGGVVLFWGIFFSMFFFEINAYVIVATPMVLMFAFVYFSARWHPYWAPICKQAMRIPWEREDGTAMETCIEIAIFAAGYSNAAVYRASIYESLTRKRTERRLIGDSVRMLGRFGPGVWFYIDDRFYPRLDGLVCMDIRTCEWLFHQPKAALELDESFKNHQGILNVIWNGNATQVDLRKLSDLPQQAP